MLARSDSKCEFCGAEDAQTVYEIPPDSNGSADVCILVCQVCREQIVATEEVDINHWRCLKDSMWSQLPAVQVMSWRMLMRLSAEGWSQDLLAMLYLDDKTLAWAQAADDGEGDASGNRHIDSNGAVLSVGDTVTLIKDLNVKGANFTAKRGTAVRG